VGVEAPALGAGPLGHARSPTRVDVEHEQVYILVTGEQDGRPAPHRAGPEDRDPAQPVTLEAGRATGAWERVPELGECVLASMSTCA
jgi:hypothetical protein